jgi:PAS domain S-box-containing protein
MNCFFLVIKGDLYHSQIIYVSKNIKSYLGYSQDELIDHSLFQFILPLNHDRLLLYLLNNHQGLLFHSDKTKSFLF